MPPVEPPARGGRQRGRGSGPRSAGATRRQHGGAGGDRGGRLARYPARPLGPRARPARASPTRRPSASIARAQVSAHRAALEVYRLEHGEAPGAARPRWWSRGCCRPDRRALPVGGAVTITAAGCAGSSSSCRPCASLSSDACCRDAVSPGAGVPFLQRKTPVAHRVCLARSARRSPPPRGGRPGQRRRARPLRKPRREPEGSSSGGSGCASGSAAPSSTCPGPPDAVASAVRLVEQLEDDAPRGAAPSTARTWSRPQGAGPRRRVACRT